MTRVALYFLLCLLLVAVAIFASQNIQTVSISFLVWQSINLPLGLVLVFCAGFGGLVATVIQTLNWRSANVLKSSSNSPISAESSKKVGNSIPSKSKSATDSYQKTTTRTSSQTINKSVPQDRTKSNPQTESPKPKVDDWEIRMNDWNNW
jgi:uncharacterized integral membrane protein